MLRFCALLLATWTLAFTDPRPASAENRVALVIGNASDAHTTPLTNTLNDARDMSSALKSIGFHVAEALYADKSQLDNALRSFADKLAGADVALFFYAGHGLQIGRQNYLVPIDAKLKRERDLQFEAVGLDFVIRQMEIDREGKGDQGARLHPGARALPRRVEVRGTVEHQAGPHGPRLRDVETLRAQGRRGHRPAPPQDLRAHRSLRACPGTVQAPHRRGGRRDAGAR